MSEPTEPTPPLSREDLVLLVARAHHGAPYAECKIAGAALAEQSKLPRLIAENLGAGFGQWTFFPEPAEVVTFACTYAPPQTSDDVWALARQWASDDAAGRPTVLVLVGRELLQVELRRIDVPELRALFAESQGPAAMALRKTLGLDIPAPRATPAKAAAAPAVREAEATSPKRAPAAKKTPVATTADGTLKMPKPVLTRAKVEPPPPPRHFEHPKFGVGVLEKLDGVGPEAKLTIRFEAGTKTLLARFVAEVAP